MDELKISLFSRKREIFIFAFLLTTLFSFNIFIKYRRFQEFKSSKYFKTTAVVISQFHKTTKRGKPYTILKLQQKNGIKFFGVSWYKNLKVSQGDELRLKVNSKKVNFYDYLKGFFASVYSIKVIKQNNTMKHKISILIKSEHKNNFLKELFSALFLGTSLQKILRLKIQMLGISHLVAISGFHLGVLSAILFFILTPVYRFFQNRYFPYRNLKLDLMILTLFLLFAYLYLVGFMPSLFRSYVMLVLGYFLYIRHIKIVSFQTIILTTVLLLSFYPSLLFSISFWFSISGVFYIFLFLRYFDWLKNWQIFLLLNIWVYLMMLPIVHFIFGIFTLYQLFSPLLSIIFVIFYPLELLLHLINHGNLLDSFLLTLFSIKPTIVSVKIPLWFLAIFASFSLLSIYKKVFLYILIFIDLSFFSYLLYSNTFG